MCVVAKKLLLIAIHVRYQKEKCKEKNLILNELCKTCKYDSLENKQPKVV